MWPPLPFKTGPWAHEKALFVSKYAGNNFCSNINSKKNYNDGHDDYDNYDNDGDDDNDDYNKNDNNNIDNSDNNNKWWWSW